ncbi:ACP S-malonyltransferase [Legionella israelensis]|uniref:Malonyl CoA-acyl carrier protein transacylase n=1 Tax=Legionella israelensis TaxID=454 RepID=A0AAX1EGG1_9GAMM|nr:ACP S-malonyltransferase [Legionella israelensis]QBR84164.1 ACP S-malonyltransferase [Legionella israelensis]
MVNKSFVFPGQGSQFVGMLHDLAQEFSIVKATFEQVSDAVLFDVWELIQQGPQEKLDQTEYTQVAMLTADVAVFKILQECGLSKAIMMAGHSLGEYAALVCADAILLIEAAPLVMKRGQLMQTNVPLGQGAMAAIIGLEDEQVRQICEQASNVKENVSAANYNAIGQVVIAGHLSAVDRAIQMALKQEARMAKKIPVSVPCHCSLLTEAAEKFGEYLEAAHFTTPSIDVISNVDLSVYQTPQQIKTRLQEQLYSPVRWVETIQLMKNRGVEMVIECGPGKVLTGLTKRIDRDLKAINVSDLQSLEQMNNAVV